MLKGLPETNSEKMSGKFPADAADAADEDGLSV
jgi:hypothetical protein